MRNGQNYLVIETEAQGFAQWTPYPGQLRLQAFSHLASGAQMVEYWHWATTANAVETYWRGLLTQDYKPNPVYAEASTIGADFKRLGPKLAGMTKRNSVAIYVSNRALSAFNKFKPSGIEYNQVLRPFYDALYRMNVEADILSPDSTMKLDNYKLIVVPALYAASDAEIARLNDYAKRGGHLVYTFKSGFSDENVKVRYATQPGAISEAAGVSYQLFTTPENVSLDGDPFKVGEADNKARWWMEMLHPTTAKVVARYKHSSWPADAAMTRNTWGKGEVTYIGFMPSDAMIEKIMAGEVERAGVEPSMAGVRFPLIVRGGTLKNGHAVRYMFNYSATPQQLTVARAGTELLHDRKLASGQKIDLAAWDLAIVEEN
jgi:beta-galactosidase